MKDVSPLIEFLRECHLADNRETGIFDLFGARVTHLYFLSGQDMIADGTLDRVVVPGPWAEPAQKAALVYRRERSLIYAPFVIFGLGVSSIGGRYLRVCAPLAWYPMEIVTEKLELGTCFVAVPDLTSPRLNFPVLAMLAAQYGDRDDRLETFLAGWPDAPFGPGAVHRIATGLRGCLPGINTDNLYHFPKVVDERAVPDTQANAGNKGVPSGECRCAPLFALVENSQDVRGVLFELDSLAGQRNDSLSAPLLSLLGATSRRKSRSTTRRHHRVVPAVLSKAQESILAASAGASISMVIGPPGTGKTFTVAAVALEHVARGESVLFAARSEQALDVIAVKLAQMLGTPGFIVRAGRKDYLRDLKDFFADLLRGAIPLPEFTEAEARLLPSGLRRLNKAVLRTERRIERLVEAEATLARTQRHNWWSWVSRARRYYLERFLVKRRPAWEEVADYQGLLEERIQLQSRLLQMSLRSRLEDMLKNRRKECQDFLGALKARTSSRQERLFQDMDMAVLLRAFPIWLVDLASLHRVLPLRVDLFDLVVLDEATHCDLASCLPALQRGRRAVITGDPRQLRHVSFLSAARQKALGERLALGDATAHSFDYRNRSLLDRAEQVVGSRRNLVFLDEHFRSRPPIIDFANRHFYRGALKIMTAVPERADRNCLELRRVCGERTASGANAGEASAVVDELCALVAAEETVPGPLCHSIGVVSPFREQVEEIQRQVFNRLPAHALEKHRLRLGTPYGFQGEERDIVLLSVAVDKFATGLTFRYLNRPDVFNVAITRARVRQVVFTSLEATEAPAGSLLRLYLETADRGGTVSVPENACESPFCAEVCRELEREGCRLYRAYPVAGLKVDLVAVTDDQPLAIDLVGSSGLTAAAFPLERYRMLHRAGLPVFPLPYSAWVRDPKASVQAILSRLKN
jgi:hypothetical protein